MAKAAETLRGPGSAMPDPKLCSGRFGGCGHRIPLSMRRGSCPRSTASGIIAVQRRASRGTNQVAAGHAAVELIDGYHVPVDGRSSGRDERSVRSDRVVQGAQLAQ